MSQSRRWRGGTGEPCGGDDGGEITAATRVSKSSSRTGYFCVCTRDKGQDVENQLLQLREFCGRQGWEITGEYVDRKTGRDVCLR